MNRFSPSSLPLLQLSLLLAVPAGAVEQPQRAVETVVLEGTVRDPSGALVPGAKVTLKAQQDAADETAATRTTTTDGQGIFRLTAPPGVYEVEASAMGFAVLEREVTLGPRSMNMDLRLRIAVNEQVTVDQNGAWSTSASENKSALVINRAILESLSSDPRVLQQEVLALAGGGGEGGANLYVDGFSGARFPSKTTIREIRINQNPFSAQYQEMGQGRVEVFTQPGGNAYHGTLIVLGSERALNAENPYVGELPPYFLFVQQGDLNGPVGRKGSFNVDEDDYRQNSSAVVNAFNTDGSALVQAVAAPTNEYHTSGRLDQQVTKTNSLWGRYEYGSSAATNSGVGGLVLASQGLNTSLTTQTVQLSDTQTFGPSVVGETRFQYIRSRTMQTPASDAPAIVVQGAFNGGGSPLGAVDDTTNKYELQEYVSVAQGVHFLRLGARYRLYDETNRSTAGYNGVFTFASLGAYLAGTPSLFSLTAGQANAKVRTGDVGAYAEDEWRLRKNVTLDVGFRLESQSAIPDHVNPAPRAGVNWAVGQTEKRGPWVTIRASAGVFYQRFAAANLLTSVRQNGVSQQEYFVTNPGFYPRVPSPAELSGTPPTPYQLSPRLRVASTNIASVSAERGLGKVGSISATYSAVRGVHQYNSENVNAPRADGTRPLGGAGDVYQFASDGIMKAQSFSLALQLSGRHGAFYTTYRARLENADTFGSTSFPSQPYNVSADYGPSGLDQMAIAQHVAAGGELMLPWGFSLAGEVFTDSRSRFNITTGLDNNGDSLFNDRPAFATNPGPASMLHQTVYGVLDANPQAGEPILPYNYGVGPRLVTTRAELAKEFKFGRRPAATVAAGGKMPDAPYSLMFRLDTVNTSNTTNAAPPIGVLTSPLFGRSVATTDPYGLPTAANRYVFLHAIFRF